MPSRRTFVVRRASAVVTKPRGLLSHKQKCLCNNRFLECSEAGFLCRNDRHRILLGDFWFSFAPPGPLFNVERYGGYVLSTTRKPILSFIAATSWTINLPECSRREGCRCGSLVCGGAWVVQRQSIWCKRCRFFRRHPQFAPTYVCRVC